MPDWWEGAAALLALAVSGISAGYTRAAHRREVRRERERQRPDVDVRFGKWVREPVVAVLVVENFGGRRLRQVTINAARGDPRLVGFAADETQERSHEHTFRDLEPGVPQTVNFVDIDRAASEKRVVKFLLDFRHDGDAWEKLYEAKLPPPGPVVLFGRAH
jgi:hypothetical protein